MVCNEKLAGIVSYGTAICAISRPDVFTRAGFFREWMIKAGEYLAQAEESNQVS